MAHSKGQVPYVAILHLRELDSIRGAGVLEAALQSLGGVRAISMEPRELLVTITFDHARTGLADIVRCVEDAGAVVASVAQRVARPVVEVERAVPAVVV